MIKRAFYIFISFALSVIAVSAQQVGSWKSYGLYAGNPNKIEVTASGKVYFLSSGRLYSYDPESEELHDYSEDFSGRRINVISYNYDRKYLFAGCDDGDVSLVYDNGDIVRMSDICDATMRYEKGINDVAFIGEDIYVATKFGLVVFNENNHTVDRSGIYGKNIKTLTFLKNYVIVGDDDHIYAAVRSQINRWENFRTGPLYYSLEMKTLDDEKGIIAIREKSRVVTFSYDPSTGVNTSIKLPEVFKNASAFINTDNGWHFTDSGKLWRLKADGNVAQVKSLGTPLNSAVIGFWNASELKNVWAGTVDGIGCYDISGSTITVKNQPMLPADNVGVERVGYITPSPDGTRIYVSNIGPSSKPASVNSEGSGVEQSTFMIDKEQIVNVASANPVLLSPCNIHEDSEDSSVYYIGTGGSGLYRIKDRKQTGHIVYNGKTAPSVYGRVYDHAIDREGNLWTMCLDLKNRNSLLMLPAAKLRGDWNNINVSDWKTGLAKDWQGQRDGKILMCKKSNLIFLISGNWNDGLYILDTKGTYSNTSDDTGENYQRLADQDQRTIDLRHMGSVGDITEDINGNVWISCSDGIFMVVDAGSGHPSLKSVKIPRNDGTGFADYLLDGETVTSISVDGNNNKWLGTQSSGIYCVGPDGTEILEHFTTDNSPLPTNTINCVYADNNSSNVYIGTNYGLMRYTGAYSPARDDYSEVYAYPNPVKPDYTGWITIVNLMDNSLVKIADTSGQVIYSGRSTGGTFTWDGCNSAGARVKSGVYYVLASQNASGNASGAVTKILILN